MMNDIPLRASMRDEAAIPHLTRTEQGDGTVCYFFGDTTIRVIEAQAAGNILLAPVSGDQVACGEWVELDEEQVHRYYERLAQCLNNNKVQFTRDYTR